MKLYAHPASTCSRKVLTTLAEKNHKAEFILVDLMKGEQKSPEHLARQPFGVVPVLDDDGFRLYESRAIIRYLDQKLAGNSLTPSDLKERAMMEQWTSVEYSYFTPAAMAIIKEALFVTMAGGTPDKGKIEAGRTRLSPVLDILEKHLAGKDYLVGSQFTLADIGYLPYVEYLFASGSGDLITSRPNLAGWWGRCSERKSWRIATGKEQG
jgi:glutathione S-transferase